MLKCNMIMRGTSEGRKVVDIRESAKRNKAITDSLHAAHALTGCDTVSSLYTIGKPNL